MTTYYWVGQTISGYAGQNVPVSALSNITDRRKVHWNNPSNWFIRVQGPTSGTGGHSYDGRFESDFYFVGASLAPGGGDVAVFQQFTYADVDYPRSPCLYGGYWGDSGWLNASSITGECEVLIDKTYGGVSAGILSGPASSRVGLNFGERGFLLNDNYGYNFTGATMTGLRLNTSSFTNKAREKFYLNLTDIQSTIFLANGTNTDYFIDGGTMGQLFVDAAYGATAASAGGSYRTNFTFRNDSSSYTAAPANVTSQAYFGKIVSSLSNVQTSSVFFTSTVSVPNIVIDVPIRPTGFVVNANADSVSVYSEERRTFGTNPGFNTIQIGSAFSPTIGTLSLKDSSDSDRFVYVGTEGLSAGYSERDVVGANNLVGLNEDCTITNLELDGGRLILGIAQDYLGTNERITCNLTDGDQVFVDNGFLGYKSMFNMIHPTDELYKGVKVGAGVSHPSEGEGLQIYSELAHVVFPKDIRFVADYESGKTGPTLDFKPSYPILGVKTR